MCHGQEMLEQAGEKLTDSWHDAEWVRELDVSECIKRGSVCSKTESSGGMFGREYVADALKEKEKLGNFLYIYKGYRGTGHAEYHSIIASKCAGVKGCSRLQRLKIFFRVCILASGTSFAILLAAVPIPILDP